MPIKEGNRMNTYDATPIEKTERIPKLVADLFAKMPEI